MPEAVVEKVVAKKAERFVVSQVTKTAADMTDAELVRHVEMSPLDYGRYISAYLPEPTLKNVNIELLDELVKRFKETELV